MKSKNVVFIVLFLLAILLVLKFYTYKISSQNIILSQIPLVVQEEQNDNDKNLLKKATDNQYIAVEDEINNDNKIENHKEIDSISKDSRSIYDPVRKKYIGIEDFNSYSKKELMNFKGIGEKTADKIIEHRLLKGNFNSFDELLDIKGIGEKKLNSLLESKE